MTSAPRRKASAFMPSSSRHRRRRFGYGERLFFRGATKRVRFAGNSPGMRHRRRRRGRHSENILHDALPAVSDARYAGMTAIVMGLAVQNSLRRQPVPTAGRSPSTLKVAKWQPFGNTRPESPHSRIRAPCISAERSLWVPRWFGAPRRGRPVRPRSRSKSSCYGVRNGDRRFS